MVRIAIASVRLISALLTDTIGPGTVSVVQVEILSADGRVMMAAAALVPASHTQVSKKGTKGMIESIK